MDLLKLSVPAVRSSVMFDAPAGSATMRNAQNRDDGFDEVLAGLGIQGSDFSNHQISAGGEQLAWSRVAVGAKRARGEARRWQVHGRWVAVWVARNLAEDPVATAGVGQDGGRPELRLREIGEREGDENYPAG
jgi:hypothetical protein